MGLRVLTPPGVPAPGADTRFLGEALREQTLPPRARVLDVCAGPGLLAITAAQRGAWATAIDGSHRAVLAARLNARLNGVRVRVLRGELLAPLAAHERFDVIVAHPPASGEAARALLDRVVADTPAHLRPGGCLLLVQPAAVGAEPTLAALARAGLEGDVVARRSDPLADLVVLRGRARP